MQFLTLENFPKLLDRLHELGYEIVGPKLDQGAIVYDTIHSVDDLPIGWTDEQSPGSYRLRRRDDRSLFGYVVGPHSWKKFLFLPQVTVLRSKHDAGRWTMEDPPIESKRYAFLGVRACELAAIGIQDRVFINDQYSDPIYADRRSKALLIAVQCGQAASTCFCSSMGTGPKASAGFDIALTEINSGFLVEIGSDLGRHVLEALPIRQADSAEIELAEQAWKNARQQITKQMNTEGIAEKLRANLDHPHWQDVAQRCLSCANCTMVCPTCFCSSVEEVHDLVDDEVLRQRHWDSCFNQDFSHVAGGPIRDQIRSRYRQWLTHKLSSWVDQFDTSGCVGCGRCITWCPVGIDLTKEVATICEETT